METGSQLKINKAIELILLGCGSCHSIINCCGSLDPIPQETVHQKLFAQFYQEDPGLITAMSSEGQYEFDRAMVDYKSGNYWKP